jgi:hypothetical protein
MELPFAVESSPAPPLPHLSHRVVYQDDNDDDQHDDRGSSSLVTAASSSSRGSLMGASQASYDPIRAALTHPAPRGGMDYPYANTQNPSSFVSVAPAPPYRVAATSAAAPGAQHSSAPPPFSNFDGLDSVLSQFGVTSPLPVPAPSMGDPSAGHHVPGRQGGTSSQQHMPHEPPNPELLNDFTYVTVCETDEGEDDVVLGADGGDFKGSSFLYDAEQRGGERRRSDRDSILALLVRRSTSALPPAGGEEGEDFPSALERANQQAQSATLAKRRGDLVQAIGCHAAAATLYRDAATLVRDDSRTCQFSCAIVFFRAGDAA